MKFYGFADPSSLSSLVSTMRIFFKALHKNFNCHSPPFPPGWMIMSNNTNLCHKWREAEFWLIMTGIADFNLKSLGTADF